VPVLNTFRLALLIAFLPVSAFAQGNDVRLFPTDKATSVNPDTPLRLTFANPPAIGTSGLIRIYDAANNKLVDTLDMSIAPSPNPTGRPAPRAAGDTTAILGPNDPNDKTPYQVNIIGGMDFHFFPIIVHDNVAMIYPHNNVLQYGHTYTVTIDGAVLKPASGAFDGVKNWAFSTKAAPPPADAARVVVAADGNGDFNTVQGAIDFVAAKPAKRVTIFIKNGHYEEIVFLDGKSNITIRGESREMVQVGYRNNSAFNPPKSAPSRRPAFSMVNATGIQLSDFTINNYFIGQAEALLINGSRNIVDHMTLNGSGDALTMRGSVYLTDSTLKGDGDTCLCYGPAFFNRFEIRSIGPFTWTRNPATNHGNVFVNSTFIAIDEPLPWTRKPDGSGQKVKAVLVRLPDNGSVNFPYAEMVLINSQMQGVPPEGWGPVAGDTSNIRLWEYNTTDLQGRRIDVSQRHPVSRQLSLPRDAQTIADYSKPEFVLDGWKPVIERAGGKSDKP
jgi:pectinesterase